MAVSGSSKNKKAPGDDEEEVPKLNEDLEQALDNADELDGDAIGVLGYAGARCGRHSWVEVAIHSHLVCRSH